VQSATPTSGPIVQSATPTSGTFVRSATPTRLPAVQTATSTKRATPSGLTTVLPWDTTISGRKTYVYRGTTVMWNWTDNAPHTVFSTSTPSAFNSGNSVSGMGVNFQFNFNTVGVFPYGCAVHSSMSGTIIAVNRVSCSGITSDAVCKNYPGPTNLAGTTLDIHQCRFKYNINTCANKKTGWEQRR